MPLALLALFAGPSVSDVVVTGIVSGRTGLRELLIRLTRWHVGLRWYAVALVTGPVMVAAVPLAFSRVSQDFIPGILTTDDKLTPGPAAAFRGDAGPPTS